MRADCTEKEWLDEMTSELVGKMAWSCVQRLKPPEKYRDREYSFEDAWQYLRTKLEESLVKHAGRMSYDDEADTWSKVLMARRAAMTDMLKPEVKRVVAGKITRAMKAQCREVSDGGQES